MAPAGPPLAPPLLGASVKNRPAWVWIPRNSIRSTDPGASHLLLPNQMALGNDRRSFVAIPFWEHEHRPLLKLTKL
jgi:hypothetical protein